MIGYDSETNSRAPGRERPGKGAEVLHRSPRLREASGLPAAGTGGIHWAFTTDNCQGDYERLKARGVNFKVGTYTEPQKQAWGTSAYFKDPDGNQFALIQPNAKEMKV